MGLLENKFAIITGAASPRGLGRATAALFAEHGATVAILDLDEDQTRAVAAGLDGDHIGLACDVTDKQSCERAAAALRDRWSRIDILVNNAGITQPLKVMEIALPSDGTAGIGQGAERLGRGLEQAVAIQGEDQPAFLTAEEPRAQLRLQHLELLADGGCRHLQLLGRLGHRAKPCHRFEVLRGFQVDVAHRRPLSL